MLPVGGVQADTDVLDKEVVIAELGDGSIGDETLGLGLSDDNSFLSSHFEVCVVCVCWNIHLGKGSREH